jgi:SAM-dependent methyltransferase
MYGSRQVEKSRIFYLQSNSHIFESNQPVISQDTENCDMSNHLRDTQLTFDSVAADYDGPAGNNPLVQRIRARTMAAVLENAPAGEPLLDLGCGTGLDAEYLARKGHRVTAIDWSPEMARRTRERIERAKLGEKVTALQLGIHEIGQLASASFGGAYSDLGSLNCVPDLESVARSLDRILLPGGKLVASVIGKICPWEVALFTLKGQWSRARFRFTDDFVAAPLNGRTVWTRYYSPGEFRGAFAGFRLVSLRALGLLTPPPYMIAFAERHPQLVDRLQTLEDRVAAWPVLREWGDHFLIAMQKHG